MLKIQMKTFFGSTQIARAKKGGSEKGKMWSSRFIDRLNNLMYLKNSEFINSYLSSFDAPLSSFLLFGQVSVSLRINTESYSRR